jgi:hypothetical protein
MTTKLSKTARIELLKKKQAMIKAKIQTLQSADKSKERKMDTRKKILIGSYYYEKAKEANKLNEITVLMDGYLKRNFDRALFGLKLLEDTEVKNKP